MTLENMRFNFDSNIAWKFALRLTFYNSTPNYGEGSNDYVVT